MQGLERPQQKGGVIGAAVMNCNPFTNGHRYLIETAASQCDTLHLFVLSEDRSVFPADVRYELVREGNTYLYLDARQCGVGGDMPGMACLREPYILHGSMPYSFRFTISPLNTK